MLPVTSAMLAHRPRGRFFALATGTFVLREGASCAIKHLFLRHCKKSGELSACGTCENIHAHNVFSHVFIVCLLSHESVTKGWGYFTIHSQAGQKMKRGR